MTLRETFFDGCASHRSGSDNQAQTLAGLTREHYCGDRSMKATNWTRSGSARVMATVLCIVLGSGAARAITTVFFNSSQTTNLVSTNATTDTISSEGYLFTYTRDKYFTGGTTNPPGRYLRVFWPDGLEAQYVTAGPTPGKAKITVRRTDGAVFDLTAFSAKLLASPGAGRAIEIVPFLNGAEPLNDPLVFDVSSGSYGSVHSFDTTTPNYIGSTTGLTNYDAYAIGLTLDYALTSLTVVDASIPPPVLDVFPVDTGLIELSWQAEAADYTLEGTTNLTIHGWSPVTNDVIFDGSFFSVQLETTGDQRLFRLRK
jgi:hypothetical protein